MSEIKWRPNLDIDGSGITNRERANLAAEVMRRWEKDHYNGEEHAVMAGDLIADLCHWLRSKRISADDIREKLESSFEVFVEESTTPEKKR